MTSSYRRPPFIVRERPSALILLITRFKSYKTQRCGKIKAAGEWTVRYREMEGSWISLTMLGEKTNCLMKL
ncbi:Neural cell adhesion molecule L1 [Manis javanica]|nr:Neural cell adhesion molecule L1 [Manis javanica]